MRAVFIVAAVVLTIPLLTLAVLYARAGKVVIVRNAGTETIAVGETIATGPFYLDGAYAERTSVTTLPAGASTWSYFFPKTNGPLELRCMDGRRVMLITLGAKPARLQISRVVLDGCGRVVARNGFAL